ncbi:uncharacterized protein LOC125240489 [Leguminivora glycinivorella]|uniref:uncharacterized protein LOC125240489 n=1 Tax=Leguminivora glycinivorella TaxID=1035111 RepID=UPI00200D7D1B|nr:uncharacterized protein LOC125240489 [Leguminivora glycinivorella]
MPRKESKLKDHRVYTTRYKKTYNERVNGSLTLLKAKIKNNQLKNISRKPLQTEELDAQETCSSEKHTTSPILDKPDVTTCETSSETNIATILLPLDDNENAEVATKEPDIIAAESDEDEYDFGSDATYVPETEESECSESDSEIHIVSTGHEHETEDTFGLYHELEHVEPTDRDTTATATPVLVNRNSECNKRRRERDFCFYCESLVLNFARHVVRNHPAETEVQRALSAPKNSKLRKTVFANLRKKGNYITNSQNESFKPMKKQKYSKHEDYLPCTTCLGFYARKQLWKHKKKCQNLPSSSKIQADAQNFLLRNIKVNQKLVTDVFPRMRADKISLEAKKDPLICSFGLQYLRTHREAHFINVTSRKMRELGKLILEIKKIKPTIKNLLDALKPENYDTLVLATKNAASFDSSKERYNSPTYAMNIATSIKQCCSIALYESYKSEVCAESASIQVNLKTLTSLIQDHWKFDVSSQAADDLNMNKYNKTTIVPLASDLKCLKEHLCKAAARSSAMLTGSQSTLNCLAYDELIETVFCRVILLNRRRPGELERLQLSYYQSYDLKDDEQGKYQEFENVLSTTEKILVNNLKRIVIRGKRGRGVPVLFSSDVQKDIDILMSQRHKYIDKNNDYMFAKSGGSLLCGYKTITKYSKLCGAKNPKALTSTRLRKHLATLSQLFNMSENEMEQLASFMGHTLSVHKQNYRLPDDVYQTAKISKLLFLMESGKADIYKGQSLDDIDLNLEEEILGDNIQNEDILDFAMEELDSAEKPLTDSTTTVTQPTPSCSTTICQPKKKRILVPWTSEQKNVVLKYFATHIKRKTPPKRHECNSLKNQHPDLLSNKDWLKIKFQKQKLIHEIPLLRLLIFLYHHHHPSY